MGEKRKHMSLDDIRAELQDAQVAHDEKREKEAHETMQRILHKMERGQYRIEGGKLKVRLWFCPNWYWDDRYFEVFAKKEYRINLNVDLSMLESLWQNFEITLPGE